MAVIARRATVVGLLIVGFIGVGVVSGAYLHRALFVPSARSDILQVFEISPGMGMRGVSRELSSLGLIRNATALEWYARLYRLDTRLQAGRYLVSAEMPAVEVLDRIVSGDAVFDEIVVTIPEGQSANDIERTLEALGLFTREEFAAAAVMQEAYRDFAFLAPLEDDTVLDGYLFPDTYRVFADSTPRSVVRRMLQNFDRRVPISLRLTLEEQGRPLHEVLTLASIVQAESNSGEMRDVAGVFWNRLESGIRLESDATVNFVLGTSKRQPTFADTEVDHPYNTYENHGLPPGPIGNPGLEAIEAAIEPVAHDFYFFLHKPDGEMVLSRTFAEHLAGKARYLD